MCVCLEGTVECVCVCVCRGDGRVCVCVCVCVCVGGMVECVCRGDIRLCVWYGVVCVCCVYVWGDCRVCVCRRMVERVCMCLCVFAGGLVECGCVWVCVGGWQSVCLYVWYVYV